MEVKIEYQSQIKSRDYQVEALQRLEKSKAFALLMRPRTGKTKVILDDFGRLELRGDVQDLLVIAPGGCYRTWEDEIKKHISTNLRSRLAVYTWRSGISKKEQLLKSFLNFSGPRIFLVNVESLSTSTTGARETCEKFLKNRSVMTAIDESPIIKNPKALRTRYINTHIAPVSKYRRIASGLPTPRSPLDLYGQFEFLDRRILNQPTYAVFQMRYAVIQRKLFANARWPTDIVVGYKNLEELNSLIDPFSYKMDFRPNIPPTWSIRDVEMTPDQMKIYNSIKLTATAALNEIEHVTATQVITQILRLHQVLCGHVTDEHGKIHNMPENKTIQLLEILDDYSGKAIIWCSYDASVKKVSEALEKEYGAGSIARFWGGNFSTREAEEKQFKEDPNCRFMVATAAAGGRGRTWDKADFVIYFSSTDNLEHRDQSEQRSQAVDKNRGCDYVDLICRGTVEEKILQALKAKINLSSIITGTNWHDWVI